MKQIKSSKGIKLLKMNKSKHNELKASIDLIVEEANQQLDDS